MASFNTPQRRGRKEFVEAQSYAQARSLAPWAVSLAWDPSRRGFWGWSDAVQAAADIGVAQAERQADLVITDGQACGGHLVRAHLSLRESDARQRAKSYVARGFVATFTDTDGQEIWSLYPEGRGVSAQIHAAPTRKVQGYGGVLDVA